MNITKKIEEIRQQPEYVRMRWVWGCVAVSMLLIVALWIFSVFAMFSRPQAEQEASDEAVPDLYEQFKQIKEDAPSLKDLSQPIGSKENADMKNEGYIRESMDEGDSESPQLNSYSNLNNSVQ